RFNDIIVNEFALIKLTLIQSVISHSKQSLLSDFRRLSVNGLAVSNLINNQTSK
ncbi:18607_t:CDS:1, partial [Rhizophagus irregularis]